MKNNNDQNQRLKTFLPKSKLKELREALEYEIEPARNHRGNDGFICPRCGSGNGHIRSTGAVGLFRDRNDDTLRWHCRSCGISGDVFDYVQFRYNMTRSEAMSYIFKNYNNKELNHTPTKKAAWQFDPDSETNTTNFSKLLYECAQNLPGSIAEQYLLKRGLTRETIRQNWLGFDPVFVYGAAITIPYPGLHGRYFTRRILDSKAYPERYCNPLKSLAGPEPLYNSNALYSQSKYIYICEGQFDCISFKQCGTTAIALGGQNPNKLIKTLLAKPTNAKLIVALDNDGDKSQKAALELTDRLQGIGIDSVCDFEIYGAHKDGNEFLAADSAGFKAAIAESIERAERRR